MSGTMLRDWIDLQHEKDQLIRNAWEKWHLTIAATVMALYGEDYMSEEQEELLALVAKTIRYHLKQDSEVEIDDGDARNVAGHLLLIVPEWRAILQEAGEKGPTF